MHVPKKKPIPIHPSAVGLLWIFVILALSLSVRIQSFAEPSSNGVTNLNTGLEYARVQEAINAPETQNGHSLSVASGTYFEHVTVNKSLNIRGAGASETVLDGESFGTVVHVTVDDVEISGFTIKNGGEGFLESGVFLDRCSDVNVSGNHITLCEYGLYIFHSQGIVLRRNQVFGNYEEGIWLYYSANNLLSENEASGNRYNFGVDGDRFSHFNNSIDESNTVNGAPIQYIIGATDQCFEDQESIGTLYLINSQNVTVRDLCLQNNVYGVFCWNGTNLRIENVTVSNTNYGIRLQNCIQSSVRDSRSSQNWVGILLHESDDNVVEGNEAPRNEKGISVYEAEGNRIRRNTVENGVFGIRLYSSHSNEIFHNNVINNTVQAEAINSFLNTWSSSGEGNFWSDYSDRDLDRDGLGDVPYEINPSNLDCCPLLGAFHSFTLTEGKPITIISNSTITDVNLLTNKTLQFQASNSTWGQHLGFCRICIPHSVIGKPYEVFVDGGAPLHWNYDLRENETHSWIYFNFEHSTREITIIPEFPSAYPIILLALGASVVLIARRYGTRT
jgi:parallel beta-helix repeat protein